MTGTEMDNARDARRQVSRFLRSRQIKQSIRSNKFCSGLDGFVTSVKLKDRVRKLSSVGRGSSSHVEMGCEVSDREDDFGSQSPPTSVCTSNRFKVPKFFKDCNGVDHASVPRKLRSAMKKRSRESISPPSLDSKKLKHTNDGIEHRKKDGPKKPKLNVKHGGSQWSPRECVSGPITKDEEEVVETLFALAGMFPDDEATGKSKLRESLEAIPLPLPHAKEGLTPAFEGSMVAKELTSICPSRKADTTMEHSIKAEESCEQTMKMNSLNSPSVQGPFELPDSKQYKLKTYSSIPPVNRQNFPFSSKNEPSDEKTLCNSLHFGFASELNLDREFEQPRKLETSLSERSPELTTSLPSQLGQHSFKEGKKIEKGLALWPGLSSTASGPILQSSTCKIPAWLDTPPSASSRPSFEASFSNDKVIERSGHKKLLKRCAAHVYISRLIQALQTPDRADRPLQPDHLKSSEGPKQETVASSFDGVRNGLSGVVSTTNIGNCSPDFFPNEVRSVLHQHAANVSGTYSSHAQSLDFFSLSSNNGTQRCHKGLEGMSLFHVPSPNPSVHNNHSHLPLTMAQTQQVLFSSTYPDRLSSAPQQVQQPHYLGTHHTDPTATARHGRQQSYQQQLLWAAQYRAGASASTLLENWQNGRQVIQCAQATSTPSLELVGSKYISIPQQQQQHQQQRFLAISPSGRIKRQEHIAAYEEAGAGLRPVPLHLQLL